MSQIATPSQKREPANVMMNDGTLSTMVMAPWMVPIAVVADIATRSAAHHGQLNEVCTRIAPMAAPTAAIQPAERSMSPRRSNQISARPNRMKTQDWTKRLTRLPADRKVWLRSSK